MAYDESLADRIREALAGRPGLTERKMFGGLGFMVRGHMAVAASSTRDLMVRVDPARAEGWIDGERVRPMEMRGKPLDGWLLVDTSAVEQDRELQLWVDRGVERALGLHSA